MYSRQLTTLATTFTIFCANSAFGQDTSTNRVNSLVAGTNAIQFAIDRDFQISSFRGSFFSYKIVTSPRSATRFGLSLSRSSSNNPNSRVLNDGSIFKSETDSLSWSTQLTAHRVFNSRPSRRLNFSWGIGPTAGYSSRVHGGFRTITVAGGLPSIQTNVSNNDFKSWNIGVYGTAGIEFFLFKNISLFVERAASVAFLRTSSTVTRESSSDGVSFFRDEDKKVSESLVLQQNVIRLGLSAYFQF